MKKLIGRDISSKVLMIGEYFKNSAPGGMAAVLSSYDEYFDGMKFLPCWKAGGFFVKAWYALYSYVYFVLLMVFDYHIKIIHIQGAAFASFERNVYFIKMGKLFGKKIILHMHCADFDSYFSPSNHKGKILSTINMCDYFIVLSRQWQDYFIGIGVRPEIVKILNNTITPPLHVGKKEKDVEKIHVLYLGIIGQRKGVYDLLKVIGENADSYRESIELHIGGNGEVDRVEKLVRDYGIGDFVLFKGFVKGEGKVQELNWADIFILPSYNEGLPIAILEAMSYGITVVSTNVGGIPEVVKHDVNGKLIEPGNLLQIKESLDFYIKNKDILVEHGLQSSDMVKPFLPENVFATLLRLYRDLL